MEIEKVKCKHGIRSLATNLPYCRYCDTSAKRKPKYKPRNAKVLAGPK